MKDRVVLETLGYKPALASSTSSLLLCRSGYSVALDQSLDAESHLLVEEDIDKVEKAYLASL